MKIAYVLGTFPAISETFILREILALRERGIEVTIFALGRETGSAKVHQAAAPLLPDVLRRPSLLAGETLGCQFHFFSKAPLTYLGLVFGAACGWGLRPGCVLRVWRNLMIAAVFACEAQRRHITRVHAHFAFMPAAVAELMAYLLGGSFSVSVHAQDIYTQTDQALTARLAEATFVAVCTEVGRDHLRQHCPELFPDKILLVRHGLTPRDFVPGKAQGSMILGVGRLEPKKGFACLLDACLLLAERGIAFTCQIAGDGPQRAALQACISEHPRLRDRVRLTGVLTQEELQKLYASASVFVLPSAVTPDGDRDGLPNAVLEAMAMELPVISTWASASTEVIRNGMTGFLVAPGDTAALADRIQELLGDASLRERLGQAGRDLVCAEFDIARNIEPLRQRFTAGTQTSGLVEP